MSEQAVAEKPKERDMNDVNKEYSQVCTKLGHLSYQVHCFNKDIEIAKKVLEELNVEGLAIQGRQKQESDQSKPAESKQE